MSNAKSKDKVELQYVYATLRSLKAVRKVTLDRIKDSGNSILDVETLFPRRFLLKLINNRLFELNKLADELVLDLFAQLVARTERIEDNNSSRFVNTFLLASKCPQLDEYFHSTLYYLYDYIIQLDWHEADISKLSESDSLHVATKLVYMRDFFIFQKALTNFNLQFRQENENSKSLAIPIQQQQQQQQHSSVEISSSSRMRLFKSNLSPSSKLNAPSRGRRVKFHDSTSSATTESETSGIQDSNEQLLSDEHEILALDLLLYSMNIFIERLCDHLNDWYKSEIKLKASLASIRQSRQKIRTKDLESISKQIQKSNDVYLACLDHLSDIRNVYLIYYVLEILCVPESGRVINIYKSRRVQAFIQRVMFEVERKVIYRLANQCLQLILELLISEINLPPVELESKMKSRQKDAAKRSRENYFNFITSWLNIDDVIYGFTTSRRPLESRGTRRSNTTRSTLATSGQFSSSSRILTQMDNLNELMRDLLLAMSERIQSKRQLKYLLELLHYGLELTGVEIANQLLNQLKESRFGFYQLNSRDLEELDSQTINDLSKNAELISAKVRCLKFIHILTKLDQSIKESAVTNDIELAETMLSTNLSRFTDECMRHTGSTYTVN